MKKNSLLYEVSGREIRNPSYFFGTMHVRDKAAFKGLDFLTDCIHSCMAFAAEFDLQQADMQQLIQASTLDGGRSIADIVSPSVYSKLAKVCLRETGISLDNLQHRSPIILYNLIAEAQFNSDEQMPLDHRLYTIAQQSGKILLGLESFEAQLSVFSKVSLREQGRSLKKIALNFKAYRRDILKAAALYVNRDIQGLYLKSKKSIGSLRRVLLYERNHKMVNSFVQIARKNSLFAAVGAGHFGGSKGVLRLLKLQGYTVKPVYYE